MSTFWKSLGKWSLKVAIWAAGHQEVVNQVVADAKAKKVGGLVADGVAIASGVQGS